MIEIHSLVKCFESVRALDGLDLQVPGGSVFGLVGPNGAGKSTLIRLLTGIMRQDEGDLRIDGEAVFENPAIKAQIACIPDEIPYWTSARIADLRAYAERLYPSFDRACYDSLAADFPLEEKALVRKLSKGQQKLAAFRIALAQRPDLVVLDEPVDGLDPVNRRMIWRHLLADVAERGTTVLVSSHNLRELEDVCDHVAILNRGKLLLQRSLSELQENIVKAQLVLHDGASLPEELKPLHQSSAGRLQSLILRGSREELQAKLLACDPLYLDLLPLSLEEIFIYELGGADDEVKQIIL